MATGALLLILGVWLILRTVVRGDNDRNLVDLIVGEG